MRSFSFFFGGRNATGSQNQAKPHPASFKEGSRVVDMWLCVLTRARSLARGTAIFCLRRPSRVDSGKKEKIKKWKKKNERDAYATQDTAKKEKELC
jgi:hypothetical protein